MKKFFQTTMAAVAVALALTSCNINDDYDLSKIDGGDFVLGDETSTFSIPLAVVSVDINTLFNSSVLESYSGSDLVIATSKSDSDDSVESYDADEIVKLLNALLPSTMPEGYEDGLDLDYIDQQSYLEPVVEALVSELKVSNSKRLILAEALLDNEEFDGTAKTTIIEDYLGLTEAELENYTTQEVADEIKTYLNDDDTDEQELIDTIVEAVLAQDFSSVTDPFEGEITDDDISIDTSVIDMLTGKLENSDFEIKFYYTVSTNLTFSFTLTVTLVDTVTGVEYELGDGDMQTITNEEELASLLENLKILYEVKTTTYSPSTGGLSGKYFNLKLMAKKKGALIL